MKRPVSFRGHSGQTYVFSTVESAGNWIETPGIALFAAPIGHTWRVIRITALRGRDDDVQPIWAHHDASRYGGDTVLVMVEPDPARRASILADLDAGLSPLWPTHLAANGDASKLALAA
ncbi:MAG: hypothetical protein AAF829_08895 [Pseudomonadota bacterium]